MLEEVALVPKSFGASHCVRRNANFAAEFVVERRDGIIVQLEKSGAARLRRPVGGLKPVSVLEFRQNAESPRTNFVEPKFVDEFPSERADVSVINVVIVRRQDVDAEDADLAFAGKFRRDA